MVSCLILDLTLLSLGIIISIEEYGDLTTDKSTELGDYFTYIFMSVQYLILVITMIELIWTHWRKFKSAI